MKMNRMSSSETKLRKMKISLVKKFQTIAIYLFPTLYLIKKVVHISRR